MVLDTVVDLSVMSYPMLIIMKEQGAVVGRGRASPKSSGETEPSPRGLGEAKSAPRRQARQS